MSQIDMHSPNFMPPRLLVWHLAESFPPTQEPFRALPTEERKTLQPIVQTLFNNISAALEKGKTQEVAISVVQPREANDAITAAETVKVSASFDTMSPLDPVTQVSYTLSPICTQCTVICTTIPTC